MNAASKAVLNTESNQAFASTFGYLFERWCAAIAREAATLPGFRARLSIDEIEDVVVVEGDRTVLFSAKSSLIPEAKLKSAASLGSVLDWVKRFFLEDALKAKAEGYRAGALHLLDDKVKRIRRGDFEGQGIRRDSLVIPVVVSYDDIGENPILYKWIESECIRLGILSARERVRPVTILNPETYEAVMASGSTRGGVADLLLRKTTDSERWGRTDWFLARGNVDSMTFRLPSTEARFKLLADRSTERIRVILTGESAPGT